MKSVLNLQQRIERSVLPIRSDLRVYFMRCPVLPNFQVVVIESLFFESISCNLNIRPSRLREWPKLLGNA